MKPAQLSHKQKVVLFFLVLAASASSPVHSQQVEKSPKPATAKAKPNPAAALTESQQQAQAILMRMAEFLAATPSFSVNLREGYDSVQTSGQKIEFGSTRKITLARPDRLRVESARSDGMKSEIVFSGKEMALIDGRQNVYAITPQPGGLDQSIVHFVHDLGMQMPLAMLLVSRLPAELKGRLHTVDYVERTALYGAPAHHLATRTATTDFQIWIADGDKPLPQKVVITYKKDRGQPQFWAEFSNWNLAPAVSAGTFVAKPPEGAQKIAFAAELRGVAATHRKAAAKKGEKQ